MKKILIPGWNLGDNSFGVTKSYMEYLRQFGVVQILTPDHPIEDCDLLVLPGGLDISPASYGQAPSYFTGNSNPMLEYFDAHKLPEYMEVNTPILAICRGAQRLWALEGGTIDQHNNWHKQSDHDWDQCHGLVYTAEYKDVYGGLLKEVNSRHHQTMSSRPRIPESLHVIAYAEANKSGKYWPQIVEIFRYIDRPIFGIQGHPENMAIDGFTPRIIRELLNP